MEALLFDRHELVVAAAAAGEIHLQLLQHRFANRRRLEALVRELQPIHRFELHAFEIVVDVSPRLLKHLVEDELHHQERRAGVELVAVADDGGVAPADVTVFLKNGDFETTRGQQHGGGQATRASADDNDVFLRWVGFAQAKE